VQHELVEQAQRGDAEAFDTLARSVGEPGTLGDVTILSGDVTAATPDEIRAMTVIATIVGGIPVHCADAEICSLFQR
jgi:hypothetical protein